MKWKAVRSSASSKYSNEMIQFADIIVIRGAPGIGKSTIGELFRASTPHGVIVDIDDMRRMINKEKFTYHEDQDYANTIKAACALVESFLELGYTPIIVVDVFSLVILELFMGHFETRKIASITLYANDDILFKRMANRASGYINLEVAKSVNRHIYQTRVKTDAWIDTSLLDPRGVLKEVIRTVERISQRFKYNHKENIKRTIEIDV
jgi:broad-specificity NMP kinase